MSSAGTPSHTTGHIKNHSGNAINLQDLMIWQGAPKKSGMFPAKIDDQNEGDFVHSAVYGNQVVGSVCGLEYPLSDGKNWWVFAWSNPINELNKVYTEIAEKAVDNWDEIKDKLDRLGKPQYADPKNLSEIAIDPTSDSPTMTATLKRAP